MLLGLSQKGMRGLALEGAVFAVSDGSRVERVFEECNREAETSVLSVLRMCRLEFVLDRCAKGAGGEQGTARSVMRQGMPEIKTPRFRCATDGASFQVQKSFAQRLTDRRVGKDDGYFRSVNTAPQPGQVVHERRLLSVLEENSAVRACVGEPGGQGASRPHLQPPGGKSEDEGEGRSWPGAANGGISGAEKARGRSEDGL